MPDDEPFNNPFASLRREGLPEGRKPDAAPPAQASAAPPAQASAAPPAQKGPARAVVRMERKGRGGKEVTVVEQLGLAPRELELWLKALKQSLGCGGVTEGATLVLQGDQRDRLPPLLEARGVRRVTIG